jgi:hypothetical protein
VAAALALLAVIPAWQSRQDPIPPPAVPRPVEPPKQAWVVSRSAEAAVRAPQATRRVKAARAPRRVPPQYQDPRPETPGDGDFIPLPFAARVSPVESLDVVRVRFPRSSMIRFGLPVPPERAWEPVNADVVVGQDGLARAIRFVR